MNLDDMGPLPDAEPHVRAARERREMPARLERAEQEGDAWKWLAMAVEGRAAAPERVGLDEIRDARHAFSAIGIDPATGKRIAVEPR